MSSTLPWWALGGILQPTREQVLDVKANFCGMRDVQGRVMFTDLLGSLGPADRADWYVRTKAAGLTHMVIATCGEYPGSPIPPYDNRANPQAFRALVVDVLSHGLIPWVMMTSGDSGTGTDVQQYWPALLAALTDLADSCIWCPGFEVGANAGWTAKQIGIGLTALRAWSPTCIIAFESIPERCTGASNPVEPDDPWQGKESAFWYSNGGQYVDICAYEAPHGSKLLDQSCDVNDEGCWLNRWLEVVQRPGLGQDGWRRVERLCLFETVASDYYRGKATDADVARIATAGQQLALSAGLTTLIFGNGLPR